MTRLPARYRYQGAHRACTIPTCQQIGVHRAGMCTPPASAELAGTGVAS